MPEEQWRQIAWAPDYFVSDHGRVRSHMKKTPIIMAPTPNQGGYLMVGPWVDGKAVTRTVHRLVAEAFIGPCPAGMEARHLDGDNQNNHLSNLTYGTKSRNALDQVVHGTHNMARKTHCPSGHAYDELNTRRAYGRRYCRACAAGGRNPQRVAA